MPGPSPTAGPTFVVTGGMTDAAGGDVVVRTTEGIGIAAGGGLCTTIGAGISPPAPLGLRPVAFPIVYDRSLFINILYPTR